METFAKTKGLTRRSVPHIPLLRNVFSVVDATKLKNVGLRLESRFHLHRDDDILGSFLDFGTLEGKISSHDFAGSLCIYSYHSACSIPSRRVLMAAPNNAPDGFGQGTCRFWKYLNLDLNIVQIFGMVDKEMEYRVELSNKFLEF